MPLGASDSWKVAPGGAQLNEIVEKVPTVLVKMKRSIPARIATLITLRRPCWWTGARP